MTGSGRAGDATIYRVDEKGGLYVPRQILEGAGLGAKMRVQFRIEDKALVIEKVAGEDNPLDGAIGRKLDRDLFGKIAREQEERKRRQLEDWGSRIEDARGDDTPPDHPFGRD